MEDMRVHRFIRRDSIIVVTAMIATVLILEAIGSRTLSVPRNLGSLSAILAFLAWSLQVPLLEEAGRWGVGLIDARKNVSPKYNVILYSAILILMELFGAVQSFSLHFGRSRISTLILTIVMLRIPATSMHVINAFLVVKVLSKHRPQFLVVCTFIFITAIHFLVNFFGQILALHIYTWSRHNGLVFG